MLKTARQTRKENELFAELELIPVDPVLIEANCKSFGLSARETDVVKLICQRLRYREIADRLYISERTVNKHAQNIFSKVEVTTRSALVRKMNDL